MSDTAEARPGLVTPKIPPGEFFKPPPGQQRFQNYIPPRMRFSPSGSTLAVVSWTAIYIIDVATKTLLGARGAGRYNGFVDVAYKGDGELFLMNRFGAVKRTKIDLSNRFSVGAKLAISAVALEYREGTVVRASRKHVEAFHITKPQANTFFALLPSDFLAMALKPDGMTIMVATKTHILIWERPMDDYGFFAVAGLPYYNNTLTPASNSALSFDGLLLHRFTAAVAVAFARSGNGLVYDNGHGDIWYQTWDCSASYKIRASSGDGPCRSFSIDDAGEVLVIVSATGVRTSYIHDNEETRFKAIDRLTPAVDIVVLSPGGNELAMATALEGLQSYINIWNYEA